MISMNRYNYVICTQRFYLFLSDLNAFLPFSYPSAVAHASRTMLNRSSEKGRPRLVPDLEGRAFSFSQVGLLRPVGLSCVAFTTLR